MDAPRKATIRISQLSARYVKPGASREERLMAARGEAPVASSDVVAVLFLLSRDEDPEVSSSALEGLRNLTGETLLQSCASPDTHPRILALLSRMHFMNEAVAEAIAGNPSADDEARSYIAGRENPQSLLIPENGPSDETAPEDHEDVAGRSGDGEKEEDDDSLAEDEEEFRSKYQLAQEMGISEKIKMAITGDKEWRMLLIKDTNKLVSGAVIKNPRLTEAEVLFIAKSPLNNDDLIRDICVNKEWVKNYQIKKALVENSKTPLHHALRFLSTLTEKDLGMLAKSKNVSSIIATQARRTLLNKKKE